MIISHYQLYILTVDLKLKICVSKSVTIIILTDGAHFESATE